MRSQLVKLFTCKITLAVWHFPCTHSPAHSSARTLRPATPGGFSRARCTRPVPPATAGWPRTWRQPAQLVNKIGRISEMRWRTTCTRANPKPPGAPCWHAQLSGRTASPYRHPPPGTLPQTPAQCRGSLARRCRRGTWSARALACGPRAPSPGLGERQQPGGPAPRRAWPPDSAGGFIRGGGDPGHPWTRSRRAWRWRQWREPLCGRQPNPT
jgi:hypothetical protein